MNFVTITALHLITITNAIKFDFKGSVFGVNFVQLSGLTISVSIAVRSDYAANLLLPAMKGSVAKSLKIIRSNALKQSIFAAANNSSEYTFICLAK